MSHTMLQSFAQLLSAQTPTAAAPVSSWMSTLASVLPLVLMFGVFYFLLIRPANKQRKEHQDFLAALKKDEEVVTASGVYGRVVSVEENIVVLEIADKVKIRILKERVAGRWTVESKK